MAAGIPACRRLRCLGVTYCLTNAADAALPLTRFCVGQRGKLSVQRVVVWCGVLYGAVPTDRAGTRTARRRPSAASLDRYLFVVAPIAGALANRVGERSLIICGLILQAIGLAWVALIAAPDRAYGTLVAPLVIAGAGISMAMPAAENAVLSSVTQTEVGKASGIFNMLRFLGGVSGIAIVVAVFASSGNFGSPQAFSAGFVPSITICAMLSLLGAAAGMWQPARSAAKLDEVKGSA